MGYVDLAKQRDYLELLLHDFLLSKGVVFITQHEIAKDELLFAFFNNSSPDMVIQGRHIFDVGESDEKNKNKYKNIEKYFTFDVLTPFTFQSVLISRGVLTQQEGQQLFHHFSLFQTEYDYWKACIKAQKMLPMQLQLTEEQALFEGGRIRRRQWWGERVSEEDEHKFQTKKAEWLDIVRNWVHNFNSTLLL